MIRLQDLTPDVYYRKSRDFQFIGRLYDVVLNSVKTNADLINILPVSSLQQDQKLTELLLLTLGFQSKHKYNLVQEKALCSAFAYLLRNKGTKEAIETACAALLASEGIADRFDVVVDTAACTVTIQIPDPYANLNLTLLKDLLNYLLPAGMSCDIIKVSTVFVTEGTEVQLNNTHLALDDDADNMTEISTIVNVNEAGPNRDAWYGTLGNATGRFSNAIVTYPREQTDDSTAVNTEDNTNIEEQD